VLAGVCVDRPNTGLVRRLLGVPNATLSDPRSQHFEINFHALFTVTYPVFSSAGAPESAGLRAKLGSSEAVRDSSIESYAASFFSRSLGEGKLLKLSGLN